MVDHTSTSSSSRIRSICLALMRYQMTEAVAGSGLFGCSLKVDHMPKHMPCLLPSNNNNTFIRTCLGALRITTILRAIYYAHHEKNSVVLVYIISYNFYIVTRFSRLIYDRLPIWNPDIILDESVPHYHHTMIITYFI